MIQSSSRPFNEYRHTPLWRALATVLSDLQASGEVTVSTAPDYVIGYMCRELAAKKVVDSKMLSVDPMP